MPLENLRKKIDQIDKKIVELLNCRIGLTLDVAQVKRKTGKSIYSPDREQEILKRIVQLNKGPLDKPALEAIYREIMSSSLSLGAKLKVAYLGPEATFTHLAALKRFGSQVEYIACNTIADIFLEVEKNNAHYGVVPVENSVEGAVSHTLDMFMDSDLKICSQIVLNVSHNLLSRSAKKMIRRVYSKLEVFGQCRLWLQQNLAQAESVEVSSTSRAAQLAAKEKHGAAIASTLAAQIYHLNIIARDIEDSPHNITRFLVIGKNDVAQTKNDRTSILFSIKDKVGALYEMLLPFKKYKINLTKIESRPSKKRAWDYYFYVDMTGHKDSPNVKKALAELEDKCRFLKVLGSYPVGE
ncbi:MAG: prephenate dehydratase [Candidatus Omnitrophica bacterium]|nr:prephenate dehydratase [Candidatus Omnitrophota bacterium]